MNARDEAILQALDKVLAAVTKLGDAVGEAIIAINVKTEIPDVPNVHEYESLKHATCGTCGRPAYPHNYRHPVTPYLGGKRPVVPGPQTAPMQLLGNIMDDMSRNGILPSPRTDTNEALREGRGF